MRADCPRKCREGVDPQPGSLREHDLLRVSKIVEKHRIHARPERRVEHDEIRLVVERHRAIIEVHRPHGAPHAVGDDRLGVEHRRLILVDLAPRLEDAVRRLAASGAKEILVLPYFLTLGIHLQRDLPKLVDDLSREHGIPIRVAEPLDGHPALSRILVDRAAGVLR